MLEILVINHRHGMLPFAYRLKREGHKVHTIINRDRYEKAWEGRFLPFITGQEKGQSQMDMVREIVTKNDVTVLTDSNRWSGGFSDLPKFFGTLVSAAHNLPPTLLGGWFNGSELTGKHVLIYDMGPQQGGQGALHDTHGNQIAGALTLIRPQVWPTEFDDHIARVCDELKTHNFKGLVQIGIRPVQAEGGGWQLIGFRAGWHFLHTHAFVADQPNLGDILEGTEPIFPKRFTVVLPVTIPPWPLTCDYRAKKVENIGKNLTEAQFSNTYFHDIQVEGTQVNTAGLDGLVAVAQGSGENLQFARHQALSIAHTLDLPEKQFRPDAAAMVDVELAQLESLGFFI